MYFVYFAKSIVNGKVYVGFTNKNPEDRVVEHNRGVNAWTKINRPFKLVYYESFICKEDAQARERFYKRGIGKRVKKVISLEMDS